MTQEEYCEEFTSPEPAQLHHIVRESNLQMLHGRMCSGHLQGRLLKMLTQMIRPQRVLELGTFTAYASLCIAEGLAENHRKSPQDTPPLLVTLEANDEIEDFIRGNISSSPYGDYVELRICEALGEMKRMEPESFDLIFIDADKRSYPSYYPEAMRLLRPGGYIFADNTYWDGKVTAEGHMDPMTRGVAEFNRIVAEDPRTEQVMLPLRDGLTLIRKRNCES